MEKQTMTRYPDRVEEVLAFLEAHPFSMHGQKMLYLDLDQLDSMRLPDVVEGLKGEELISVKYESQTITPLNPGSILAKEHMADVTAAMMFLACGGLDEAHDLVLPYSWPMATPFGGPPVKDSEAANDAEYCHSLVHRHEGQHFGEGEFHDQADAKWIVIRGR
jgi:hypothetical protein